MSDLRWSRERANEWYEAQPWLVGCNFVPSTAINQLEMWQEESFDLATIDRELGWAAGLGFNTMRVYLHDLVWQADGPGFKRRIDRYLDIALGHGISTLFVLFDDCWHDNPRLGTQPKPIPGIHNSGWAQSPGSQAIADRESWGRLESYVQDIVGTYGADERVLMWDLYNEVGNNFLTVLQVQGLGKVPRLVALLLRQLLLPSLSMPLLKETFAWSRAVQPTQPLTCSLWFNNRVLNRYLLETCDVITFHNYKDAKSLSRQIRKLQSRGRPVVCTEYMARTQGSRFETHLPIFKREGVGCYNWGLVSGKTQTIYPWTSKEGAPEPEVWFHDIFRGDGTPYSQEEVALIRRLTGE